MGSKDVKEVKTVNRTVYITLTNDKTITIELFERIGQEGFIEIRAENTLRINPVASNVIAVGVED